MNNIDWVHLLNTKIEELQQENEVLKKQIAEYEFLIEMQNNREYRSKFLKEFQKEHGKNVFPDYDEIYKRYDKLKEEKKHLENNRDKAIEIIDSYDLGKYDYSIPAGGIIELRDILKGDSDDTR